MILADAFIKSSKARNNEFTTNEGMKNHFTETELSSGDFFV
jgi:hypothetical protein